MYIKRHKIRIVIKEIKENAKKLRYALKPAGISRCAWYLWEVDNPRLKRLRIAAQRLGKEDRVEMMEDALFKNGIEGNLGAQCFFLKNEAGYKDALIDQSQHQHFVSVNVKELDTKSIDELVKTALGRFNGNTQDAQRKLNI